MQPKKHIPHKEGDIIESIGAGKLTDTLEENKYKSRSCVAFMPIIGHCLSSMPVAMSDVQARIIKKFFTRIQEDKYLLQSWMFYLNTTENLEILRLWDEYSLFSQGKVYKSREIRVSKFINFTKDNVQTLNSNAIHFFVKLHEAIRQDGNKKYREKIVHRGRFGVLNQLARVTQSHETKDNNNNNNNNNDDDCNSVSVQTKRMLENQEIYDPITGKRLRKVELRSIIDSTNRPLLLDCYTMSTIGDKVKDMNAKISKGIFFFFAFFLLFFFWFVLCLNRFVDIFGFGFVF